MEHPSLATDFDELLDLAEALDFRSMSPSNGSDRRKSRSCAEGNAPIVSFNRHSWLFRITLSTRNTKMHVRVFLSRWRTYILVPIAKAEAEIRRPCPTVRGGNLAELCRIPMC